MSSTLAVAMEYLGLLKDDCLKEYAQSRGGLMISGNTAPDGEKSDFQVLTFRELLKLLPE